MHLPFSDICTITKMTEARDFLLSEEKIYLVINEWEKQPQNTQPTNQEQKKKPQKQSKTMA